MSAVRVSKSVSVTKYVNVDVDVDVDVTLDDFETKNLVEELRSRGEWPDVGAIGETLVLIREAIRRRDIAEALYLLDREIEPKWRRVAECEAGHAAALKQARA